MKNTLGIWGFPKMVVPPKHHKMIIFSRKTHGCFGTTILGNPHMWNIGFPEVLGVVWSPHCTTSPAVLRCEQGDFWHLCHQMPLSIEYYTMYGIFTCIWLILMANVSNLVGNIFICKYTIHGSGMGYTLPIPLSFPHFLGGRERFRLLTSGAVPTDSHWWLWQGRSR